MSERWRLRGGVEQRDARLPSTGGGRKNPRMQGEKWGWEVKTDTRKEREPGRERRENGEFGSEAR